MKKILVIVSLFTGSTIFFAACRKTDAPLKADGSLKTEAVELNCSAAQSKVAGQFIEFKAPDVFPEGIVYNPFSNQFLVSSILMGTIGTVSREGVYSEFIKDAALASTAGLEIDKAHKRLLVTSSLGDGSLAQLAIYNLDTKARLFLVDLAAVASIPKPHLANDVALDQHGNAYVTDSYAGIIYKVDQNGKATIFYQNDDFTPDPGGFGFNGIEYSNSKGGYLLVAHSARNEIIKFPIDNPGSFTIVQLKQPIASPDGLLLSKNSKELIVVNNTVQFPGSKVVSLQTSDSWATASTTATFNTAIVYPTTVTSDGKNEYVLYSYLHLLFSGGSKDVFTIQALPFNSNNPF